MNKAPTSVRILPAAAIALILLLGLKLAGAGPGLLTFFSSAQAADGSEPAGDHAAAPAPVEREPTSDEDPVDMGPKGSEADVLEQLAKRREQLDAREREIDLREKTLLAAEKRIQERVAELKEIQANVEAMFGKKDENQEKQLADLVKMYETMKPANAAQIFNTLEAGVLLDVFSRMKPAKASPILAAMKPERAQEVTVELARRGRMPEDIALPAGGTGKPGG